MKPPRLAWPALQRNVRAHPQHLGVFVAGGYAGVAQVAVKVARVACVQAERGVTVAEQRDFFDSVETEMPQRWLSCCKV